MINFFFPPCICRLFRKIDQNNNTKISAAELRAMVIGLQIEEVGLDEDDFVNKLMEEFDVSNDSNINENEFTQGVSNWLSKGKINNSNQRQKKKKSSNSNSQSKVHNFLLTRSVCDYKVNLFIKTSELHFFREPLKSSRVWYLHQQQPRRRRRQQQLLQQKVVQTNLLGGTIQRLHF